MATTLLRNQRGLVDRRNCNKRVRRFKKVSSISRNSLQPTYTPSVPKELVQKYKNLPSLFYTVDYAEKEDGSWIIIETGDGGVSGLSEGQNYDSFYRALDIAFNNEIKMEKE